MTNHAYYNTTHRKGKELRNGWKRAEKSSDACWRMLREYGDLSPWQVYGCLWLENGKRERFPITSVRRALHTLEQSGKIKKTGRYRIGKRTGAKENIFTVIR